MDGPARINDRPPTYLERAQALAEKHDVLLDLFKLYRNDDPQRALRYRSEAERIERLLLHPPVLSRFRSIIGRGANRIAQLVQGKKLE
jgi:hypothetical protein